MIDPQYMDRDYGGLGMVAMFYFPEDGKDVQVRYYSTAYDAYWFPENQFSITLDIPEGGNDTPPQAKPNGTFEVIAALLTKPAFYIVLAAIVIAISGVAVYYYKKKTNKSDNH